MVAIGIVWTTVLANYGPINQFLMTLGMENPPQWLSSTTWALISVEMVSIWRSMGYNAVILLAGLQGINVELYEAAKIDGANEWKQWLYITIPSMKSSFTFVIITSAIAALKRFTDVYAISGETGNPAGAGHVASQQ